MVETDTGRGKGGVGLVMGAQICLEKVFSLRRKGGRAPEVSDLLLRRKTNMKGTSNKAEELVAR